MPILNVPSLDYATIAAALTAAAASGDTILIANGTYSETLTISKSVTIEGASKANTIITSATNTMTITANNVTLQNLTVQSDPVALVGAFSTVKILGNISNTTFNNVDFTSASRGISEGITGLYLDNNDPTYASGNIIKNVTLSECVFANSAAAGIKTAVYTRTLNVTIYKCTFTNIGTQGIYSATVSPSTTIASNYMEVGNVNWDINECIFTNIGNFGDTYPGPIFLEKFGNSKIRNCIFNGWNSYPANNYRYAFAQISIKRASSSQGPLLDGVPAYNTYNGENIEITGNTFIGKAVVGTTTRSTSGVGLWVQGRSEGTTNSLNPGLIKDIKIENNTFTDIGTALRISGNITNTTNINDNSITIDGNRFTNLEQTTGATFRRTDITVSGPTFRLNNHGYVAGEKVLFGSSSIPANMPGGLASVDYFVIGTPTQNTFQVSTSAEGSAVSTSSAGTGLFVDGPSINFPSLRKPGAVLKNYGTDVSPNFQIELIDHGLVVGSAIVFGSETRQLPDPISITNVDITTEIFTTSVNHGFATGDSVRLSATTMPAPLVLAKTTYKVIYVSPTQFKLGLVATPTTVIAITSAGTNVCVYSASVGIAAGVTYYVYEATTSYSFRIGGSSTGTGASDAISFVASSDTVYFDKGHGVNSSDVIQIVGGTTALTPSSTDTYYVKSVPNQFVFKIAETYGGTALTPASISTASLFNFRNNRSIDVGSGWGEDPKSSLPIFNTTTPNVNLTNARTSTTGLTITGDRALTSFNTAKAAAISGVRSDVSILKRLVSAVNTTTNLFTTGVAHGFQINDRVLVTGTLGSLTGVSVNTAYLVESFTPTTLTLKNISDEAQVNIEGTYTTNSLSVEAQFFTLTAHGYSEGDSIIIPTAVPTIGTNPAGTTYSVSRIRDQNSFYLKQGTVEKYPTTSTTAIFTINGPSVFSVTSHGYVVGNFVGFSGTSIPAGLEPISTGTLYYVKSIPTLGTFLVSTSSSTPAVNLSSTGSVSVHNGTMTLTGHGYLTGDDVKFTGTALPSNVDPNVTYKVINPGANANTFRFGTTTEPAIPIVPFVGSLTSITVSGPCLVSLNSHGFLQANPVYFTTTGTLPIGINPNGTTTMYYPVNISPNTFQLSLTQNGTSKIITSGTSTGTYSVNSGATTPTPLTVRGITGYTNGNPIFMYSSGSLPVGITPYQTYYVINVNTGASTFQLALEATGTTPINTTITATSFPSGSHTISKYNPNYNINQIENTITIKNHGYKDGDIIFFKTTGTLPTGLTPTVSLMYGLIPTLYYVRDKTTDTFKVAAYKGGPAITLTTGGGIGTHTIRKFFTFDAKQCYFDIISPTKVISDSSITDTQRYSLIKSLVVSDNRVSMTATSTGAPTIFVPITPAALFNAPMNTPLVIIGAIETYDNSVNIDINPEAESVDLQPFANMSLFNIPRTSPNIAGRLAAGVKSITAGSVNFVFTFFRSDGTVISTFTSPVEFRIGAVPSIARTANVYHNGATSPTTTALYNAVLQSWIVNLSENPEWDLDPILPCLVEGTKVLTASGYVNVEDLKAGTRVVTGDKRIVEVVKVHNTKYNRTSSITAPYIIEKDAFGVNYPKNEIKISGRHSIQLKSGLWEIPSEAARANGKVHQVPVGGSVKYYHVELPDYENDTMVADGLIVESYNNGNYDESYTWNAAKQGYERKVVHKF